MLEQLDNCTDCAAHSASSAPPRYLTEMFRLAPNLVAYRVVKRTIPHFRKGKGISLASLRDGI